MSLSALKAKKREQMEAMKQESEAAATRQPAPQLRAPEPTARAAAGRPRPQLLPPPPVEEPADAADDATAECVREVAAWRAANRGAAKAAPPLPDGGIAVCVRQRPVVARERALFREGARGGGGALEFECTSVVPPSRVAVHCE